MQGFENLEMSNLLAKEDRGELSRDEKYNLVRMLFISKKNGLSRMSGMKLTNFHFTPGPKFDEMSVWEMVEILEKISGELSRVNPENNPPVTGKPKRNIRELIS